MGDNYREVDLTANGILNTVGNDDLGVLNMNTYSTNSTTKTLYTMQSDEIGNMTNVSGLDVEWNGRRLESISQNGTELISYKYNIDGQRILKTYEGVTTEYFYNGDILAGEKTGNNVIIYMYDNNGDIFGFTYNGTEYYYIKNAQNDIVAIADASGNIVVRYYYNAWGEIIDCVDNTTFGLSSINPITYRSYYNDNVAGMDMYYLNSRYYMADWGRFVSADSYVQTGQGMLDKNMFAYCGNNPVNRVDPTGQSWADVKNWVAEKWNSVKKTIENTWNKLKTNITNAFKELPYETADDAALASGINLNNLTQQNNHEYGQGIVYNRITKTYGLTDIVQGEHESVNFSSTINNNKNLVAVVHSHPCCNGHIGNEFSNSISDDNGNVYGDWVVASSNSINVYLAAPNGNLYVMYWDVGEYNQNFVCDGLPIDNSQINCG